MPYAPISQPMARAVSCASLLPAAAVRHGKPLQNARTSLKRQRIRHSVTVG